LAYAFLQIIMHLFFICVARNFKSDGLTTAQHCVTGVSMAGLIACAGLLRAKRLPHSGRAAFIGVGIGLIISSYLILEVLGFFHFRSKLNEAIFEGEMAVDYLRSVYLDRTGWTLAFLDVCLITLIRPRFSVILLYSAGATFAHGLAMTVIFWGAHGIGHILARAIGLTILTRALALLNAWRVEASSRGEFMAIKHKDRAHDLFVARFSHELRTPLVKPALNCWMFSFESRFHASLFGRLVLWACSTFCATSKIVCLQVIFRSVC